jgi:hypothetical protein
MSAHAPIDAVITWVDGSDPAHAARLAEFLGTDARPVAAHATRFADAGEIEWCVASILRFAPWMRRIHIVTDRQVPPLVAKLAGTRHAERVRVVDHREIFAGHERHLPTFNSRAIITALWRVPEMAERFVYFNDDFVLLRPVAPTDFFRDDGRMVLRGDWRPQQHTLWWRRLLNAWRARRGGDRRVRNLAAQEESARLAGYADRYLRLYHNPFPMRVPTLAQWFAQHPEKFDANAAPKLRSELQFKTEALAAHLELAQGTGVLDNGLRTLQLKPGEQWGPRMRAKMAAADADPRTAFAVVQSLDQAAPETQALLRAWLDRRVGTLAEAIAGA